MTENEEGGDVSTVVAQNLLYVAATPGNSPATKKETGPFEFAESLDHEIPGLIYSIVIFFALSRPFKDRARSFFYLNMVQKVLENTIDPEHKRARLFVCMMQSAKWENVRDWIVGSAEYDEGKSKTMVHLPLGTEQSCGDVSDCSIFRDGVGNFRYPDEDPLKSLRKQVKIIPNAGDLLDVNSQPGSRNGISTVIFRYAAYKLIIDRKDEVQSFFGKQRIRAVVEMLYHFATFNSIDSDILEWTINAPNYSCIEGLLTTVVTWSGIYFADRTPTEVRQDELVTLLTQVKVKEIDTRRANEFLCMFEKTRFDRSPSGKLNKEDYILYFNFGMHYLRTGENGGDRERAKKPDCFDECVKPRVTYY